MPVLHWGGDDTSLARDGLVAEVRYVVVETVDVGQALLDRHLKVVQQLEVALLEDISVCVLLLVWGQPDSVDTEERSELVDEVLLFNICAGGWRHPELLRVVGYLEIDEAHRAKAEQHKAREDEQAGIAARRHSQTEG